MANKRVRDHIMEPEMMECPYNKSHKVNPLRMPYHLMKCRKKYPDVHFAVCPYSALHEVPPIELQFHMTNCPNKRLVEGVNPPHALMHALSGKETNMLKGCTDIPPMSNVQFDDDEESWDDNIVVYRGHIPQPTTALTQRCRTRHSDESSNLRISRNSVPADLQVRRPISHSVAARLKPELSSDSSGNHSTRHELFKDVGYSDFDSDSASDMFLLDQEDHLPASQCLERRISPVSNKSSDFTHGEGRTEISAEVKRMLQARGRASLLAECFPNRPEKRPGRGRLLGKIPTRP